MTTILGPSVSVDRFEALDQALPEEFTAELINGRMLIDRHCREVVVHWRPVGGQYTHQSSAVFGEKLPLPEPFSFELDTTNLV